MTKQMDGLTKVVRKCLGKWMEKLDAKTGRKDWMEVNQKSFDDCGV